MTTTSTVPKKYYIDGFFIVAVLGTLGHFFYDWSGQNPVWGLFFPVNESTWEHMKLVFFPMLLWTGFFMHRFQKDNPCFVCQSLCATLLGTALIPILFYSYSGILGYHIPAADISTFYISVIFTFVLLYKIQNICFKKMANAFILALTILFFLGFLLFSYHAPELGIFENPAPIVHNSP